MNNRFRLFFITLGALLVAATFTFPLWRPVFVDDVVSEGFPGLNAEQQVTLQALPTDQRGALQQLMVTADATMVVGLAQALIQSDFAAPTAEQDMPDVTNPIVVARGTFTRIDAIHAGSGTVTIYELPDTSRILRFEDFRVTNGPDLHVILTRNPDPRDAAQVGIDYIDLGPLKGNVGNQNYAIPPELELGQYRGVVIYCVPFQVVFSTAILG